MDFGIEIHGPYKDISGISYVNRELALALYDIGIPTLLTELALWSNLTCPMSDEQQAKIRLMERTRLPDEHIYANYMPLHRILDIKSDVPNVCATVYETDKCPYVWGLIDKQSPMDEIWVPTEWGKEAFVKGGLDREKIQVMPLGVNTKKYNPDVQPANIVGRRKFVFLCTMDYKACKGPDVLLNAYFQEFSNKDDVTLVFKAYSGGNVNSSKHYLRQILQTYRQANNSTAHVLFIGDHLSESEMVGLHRAADCYVLPTRGEGWSFGTIQSMACGVPTIMTDGSAHRSYMNETNGLLIKAKQVPIEHIRWLVREPNQSGHEWFEPDLADLKKQMRYAYEHPWEMKELGEQAHKDVQKLDWTFAAQRVANRAIELLR